MRARVPIGHEAKEAISKVIQDPRYKTKTDEVKVNILADIIQNYRNKHIARVKSLQRAKAR